MIGTLLTARHQKQRPGIFTDTAENLQITLQVPNAPVIPGAFSLGAINTWNCAPNRCDFRIAVALAARHLPSKKKIATQVKCTNDNVPEQPRRAKEHTAHLPPKVYPVRLDKT